MLDVGDESSDRWRHGPRRLDPVLGVGGMRLKWHS